MRELYAEKDCKNRVSLSKRVLAVEIWMLKKLSKEKLSTVDDDDEEEEEELFAWLLRQPRPFGDITCRPKRV